MFCFSAKRMSESFEAFAERFLSDLKRYFKEIVSYKSDVTSSMIKIRMYYFEQWDEIDFKTIHAICNGLSKKYQSEFVVFNISSVPFFYFNGEKGKLTVKWFVEQWRNQLK